jgi:hypothetical protein
MLSRTACSLAAVVVAAALAGTAAADGDPASDVLYFKNVFVPYPPPAADAVSALNRTVSSVFAHGDRVKVAVIATRADLGSVPELFGQPEEYARFLGTELRGGYIGPLLIVMPAGFGIYDGGRSTAAEERVLAHLDIQGTSGTELTRTAATAVQRLAAAHALVSKDIMKPMVQTFPAKAHRGTRARLRFAASDDSGRIAFTIRILAAARPALAVIRIPLGPVDPAKLRSVAWQVPAKLPARRLRFCVNAVDRAGNRSVRSCAPLTVA